MDQHKPSLMGAVVLGAAIILTMYQGIEGNAVRQAGDGEKQEKQWKMHEIIIILQLDPCPSLEQLQLWFGHELKDMAPLPQGKCRVRIFIEGPLPEKKDSPTPGVK